MMLKSIVLPSFLICVLLCVLVVERGPNFSSETACVTLTETEPLSPPVSSHGHNHFDRQLNLVSESDIALSLQEAQGPRPPNKSGLFV